EILGYASEIVEIGLAAVLTEICALDVGIAEIRDDAFDVLRAVMDHAEATTGESRIPAALFLRRALEQRNPRACLGGCQRGAKCSIAAAHDHDVEIRMSHF